MDLNYLLHRYQLSLMLGDVAASREARRAHHGLAAGYAGRIRVIQQDLGATFEAIAA